MTAEARPPSPDPRLFDIPVDLIRSEWQIRSRYDGTVDYHGHYGVVVVLERASGHLLFATLTDLYGTEKKRKSYQPTDRGKWSAASGLTRGFIPDITPKDAAYAKLNAIEDYVRDRWRETPVVEKSPGQFRTHLLVNGTYMVDSPSHFRRTKPRATVRRD